MYCHFYLDEENTFKYIPVFLCFFLKIIRMHCQEDVNVMSNNSILLVDIVIL
jgi:hypothetical protein